jgi:hypothetical protein
LLQFQIIHFVLSLAPKAEYRYFASWYRNA